MKVAIPVNNGVLCMHFGHCSKFTIVEADEQNRTITSVKTVEPPPHEPGLLPRWLHEMGVTVVIAGGIGARAMQIFSQAGVSVIPGAPADKPEVLVRQYLKGELNTGENVCDH